MSTLFPYHGHQIIYDITVFFHSAVYQLGALMPERESRVVEYKAGGGNYTSNILPAHINKYGSAFLNSSGGTLCIGVNDDGNAL